MTVLKHPMSGATYTLRDDGFVEVDNNGLKGVCAFNRRYQSGDLRQADPHMLLWMAGPQLPDQFNLRRNR